MKTLLISLLVGQVALAAGRLEKEWTVQYQEGRWKVQVWFEKKTACLKLFELSPGPPPLDFSLNDYPPGYRDGIDSYTSGPFHKVGDHYELPLTSPAPGAHRLEVYCAFRKMERNIQRTDPQCFQKLSGWIHRF